MRAADLPEVKSLDEEAPAVIADLFNELKATLSRAQRDGEGIELSNAVRRFLDRCGQKGPLVEALDHALSMLRVLAEYLGFDWEDMEVIAKERERDGLSVLPDPIERVPELPVFPSPPVPPSAPNWPGPFTPGTGTIPIIITTQPNTTGTITITTTPAVDTTWSSAVTNASATVCLPQGSSYAVYDANGNAVQFNACNGSAFTAPTSFFVKSRKPGK